MARSVSTTIPVAACKEKLCNEASEHSQCHESPTMLKQLAHWNTRGAAISFDAFDPDSSFISECMREIVMVVVIECH